MGLLGCLLEDHEELRRSMAAMTELLRADECSGARRIGPATAQRLLEMECRMTSDLKAHETLENRFVDEALKEAGEEGEALLQTIKCDHESVREVFRILSALTSLGEGVSAYSIRFALSSLAHNLERHLDYEEKKAFPLMTRFMSAVPRESRLC